MRWLSPSTQVWIFVFGSSLSVLFLGYRWGERLGLLVGLFVVVFIQFFTFGVGDEKVVSRIRTRRLRGTDPDQILRKVTNLSRQTLSRPPELEISPERSLFALTIGHPWQRGRLILSHGLVESLGPAEIEAVLAHQIAQLQRMNSFRYGIVAGLSKFLSGLAQTLDRGLGIFWRGRRPEFFLKVISPINRLVIRLSVGPDWHLRNDDLAVQITGGQRPLAQALWKMESCASTRPYRPPAGTEHLFVTHPDEKPRSWFLTHPRLQERLKRLIGTETI